MSRFFFLSFFFFSGALFFIATTPVATSADDDKDDADTDADSDADADSDSSDLPVLDLTCGADKQLCNYDLDQRYCLVWKKNATLTKCATPSECYQKCQMEGGSLPCCCCDDDDCSTNTDVCENSWTIVLMNEQNFDCRKIIEPKTMTSTTPQAQCYIRKSTLNDEVRFFRGVTYPGFPNCSEVSFCCCGIDRCNKDLELCLATRGWEAIAADVASTTTASPNSTASTTTTSPPSLECFVHESSPEAVKEYCAGNKKFLPLCYYKKTKYGVAAGCTNTDRICKGEVNRCCCFGDDCNLSWENCKEYKYVPANEERPQPEMASVKPASFEPRTSTPPGIFHAALLSTLMLKRGLFNELAALC